MNLIISKLKPEAEEVPLYSVEGDPIGKVKLPKVFYTPIRVDLIRRAVLSILSTKRQPQGRDPMAGKRTTAESWGVGHGVARVPRIKGSSRAAFIPGAVGGRQAHPPVTLKKIVERINRKEKKIAFKSAIAATAIRDLVTMRGHVVETIPTLPIVVEDALENLVRTSEVKNVFIKLGVWGDVERAAHGKRIRAGKGKMRGRRYKKPKSVLVVVNGGSIIRAGRNLPGVDVVKVSNLSVIHLAPGGHPGRLTIYTVSALAELEKRW